MSTQKEYIIRVDKNIKTSSYTYANSIDVVKWATHCLFKTGEKVKLSAEAKLIYEYRLNRFKHFLSLKSDYVESNKSVADHLGLKQKTIEDVYNKQLKDSGLMVIDKTGKEIDGKTKYFYSYTMYTPDELKSNREFINENLKGYAMREFKKSAGYEKYTYEQLKNRETNRRNWQDYGNRDDAVYTGVVREVLLEMNRELRELREYKINKEKELQQKDNTNE